MTDHEVLHLLIEHRQPRVFGGWLMGTVIKRDGTMRAIVEDKNGHLYIRESGNLHSALNNEEK